MDPLLASRHPRRNAEVVVEASHGERVAGPALKPPARAPRAACPSPVLPVIPEGSVSPDV